jgi:uncharacterized protein HemY
LGSASRYLGILAATLTRWDDASRHFEQAIAMNTRMGAAPWVAHTQADYARMLCARDGPGDTQKVTELRREALVVYRRLGMESGDEGGGDRRPLSIPQLAQVRLGFFS